MSPEAIAIAAAGVMLGVLVTLLLLIRAEIRRAVSHAGHRWRRVTAET